MSYRWQYPGRMQPTLAIARTVAEPLPDKWGPKVEGPPRRQRALTAAILAGAMFFVPLVASPAVVTVDQWHPKISEPVRQVERGVNPGFSAFSPLPTPTILQWSPELPDLPPRRAKALPVAAGQIRSQFFVQTETPFPLFRPLSEPVRVRPRPLNSGIQALHTLPLPTLAAPNMESWEPRLVVPVPRRKPLAATGLQVIDPAALKLPEPAQIDKWGQPVGTPPRGHRPQLQAGLTVVHPLPLPTLVVPALDSWEPRLVVPAPLHKPLVAVGLTVIAPAALTLPEPPQLDKWYQSVAVPRRDVERWQWLYPHFFAESLHTIPAAPPAASGGDDHDPSMGIVHSPTTSPAMNTSMGQG